MKETWAKDIQDHLIRIEAPNYGTPLGCKVSIIDQTTGEPILNCHKILLQIKPEDIIIAIIGLGHIVDDQLKEETVETDKVSVALSAYVEEAKDIYGGQHNG